MKNTEEFNIGGETYLVDAGVSSKLAALPGKWRKSAGGGWVYNVRASDSKERPQWKPSSSLSLTTVAAHLSGLNPEHMYRQSGDPHDLRSAHLGRATYRSFITNDNPDAGIQPAVGGRFRARAYVNGYQRALGTFDTIELARQARDEAIAHPERFPADRPVGRKTQPKGVSPRRARAMMQAERESLLARLKYLDLQLANL